MIDSEKQENLQGPEYSTYEGYHTRNKKREEIEKLGINPYPHKYTPTTTASLLHDKYLDVPLGNSTDAEENKTDTVTIAGRLVLFRAMGKNAFAHIQDEQKRIQIMINRDHTLVTDLPLEGEQVPKPIKFLEKKLDLGDIIGVRGNVFRTQKGELTIYAKEITLLTKSLLPLPDKHAGLTDKGIRYRKRWLDLIADPSVVATFKTRSQILEIIREYYKQHNYMEVETPILQNIYGGAEARPFATHLNALNQDMFLRIAIEIALKKLIVGGLPRVFEIGKVFRNEGIDKTHNPEFTMLESYASYWDYNDLMVFTENLFATVATKLLGSTKIGKRKDKKGIEHEVDLKTPWKRMSMKESLQTYAHLDVDTLSDTEMKELLLKKTDVEKEKIENASRGKCIALLFEELVEQHLIQPHHIIDHPIETTPLCKLHRNLKLSEEGFVERFETFILGYEFCNAYTELNDPILQRTLLEKQQAEKDSGNEEANPLDEEFLEAICQGMPPTGGLGIGIDRMTMLFTGVTSIRDVLYFPLMRLEE